MKAGKVREIPGGGSVEEYKEVNRKESLDLADAFLSTKFVIPFLLELPLLFLPSEYQSIIDTFQVPRRTRTVPQVKRKKCHDIHNSEAHQAFVVETALIRWIDMGQQWGKYGKHS